MEFYKTKDIGEASALINNGLKLNKLEYNAEGYFLFCFESPKLAEVVAHTYWFGNLTQNVKKYNEALQNLKDMVHSQAEIVKGRTVSVKERF